MQQTSEILDKMNSERTRMHTWWIWSEVYSVWGLTFAHNHWISLYTNRELGDIKQHNVHVEHTRLVSDRSSEARSAAVAPMPLVAWKGFQSSAWKSSEHLSKRIYHHDLTLRAKLGLLCWCFLCFAVNLGGKTLSLGGPDRVCREPSISTKR